MNAEAPWTERLAEIASRPTRPPGSCPVCSSAMVAVAGRERCGNSTADWHVAAAARIEAERNAAAHDHASSRRR